MLSHLQNTLKKWQSYLWGVKLQTYHSELNGLLGVWLVNNRKVLNSKNANQSFDSLHRIFQKAFQYAAVPQNHPKDVLLLGLACGSVPAILFDEMHLHCKLTAVEYDPVMLQIANEHFSIERFSNMEVVPEEAVHFMSYCANKFDLVVVDLFNDNEVPAQFTEPAFLEKLSKLLQPGGTLIFNMITISSEQQQKFKQVSAFFQGAQNMKAEGTNQLLIYKNKVGQ